MSPKKLTLILATVICISLSAGRARACAHEESDNDRNHLAPAAAGIVHSHGASVIRNRSVQNRGPNTTTTSRVVKNAPILDEGEEDPSAGGPCIHDNGCSCRGLSTHRRLGDRQAGDCYKHPGLTCTWDQGPSV
jgi:hypothetical protein